MRKIALIIFTLCIGLTTYGQSKLVKKYSRCVFFDKNFEFDGEVLKIHGLDNFDIPSKCYEDEDRYDKSTRFYDCHKDGKEAHVILSNIDGNSFTISAINRNGFKNYSKNTKTRSVTTEVKKGNVDNQFICDFDSIAVEIHHDIIDMKCHLVDEDICSILEEVKDKNNANSTEVWAKFINHLKSRAYREKFDQRVQRTHKDIFTVVNSEIPERLFNKNLKFNSSVVMSTLETIEERERQLQKHITKPAEYFNDAYLKDLLGTNMLTMCSRMRDLWDIEELKNE